MKKLNERLRQSIGTHVRRIIQNEFDEDTLKLLLIDIRDFSVGLDNLREICHFVAHPERDQGAIHKKILSRFLRIEYMQTLMESAIQAAELFRPGPKEDFGDYVFRTVPTQHYKILSKTTYESVILGGLHDFDDSFFTSMFKLTREETRKHIESQYRRSGESYLLRTDHSSQILKIIFILETSVHFRHLISLDVLFEELLKSLTWLCDDIGVGIGELVKVINYRKEILISIVGMLHDITFVWQGRTIGRSFLGTENGKISLFCEFFPLGKKFRFTLVSTGVEASNYQDSAAISNQRDGELVKFCLRRNSLGRLVYC